MVHKVSPFLDERDVGRRIADLATSVNAIEGGTAEVGQDRSTVTLSSNAGIITTNMAVVTTESLTTAHTATQALVITKTGAAATDVAFVTRSGGTNTGGIPEFTAVCTTNTVTVTLRNMAKATDAFNGTFVFNLLVVKGQ